MRMTVVLEDKFSIDASPEDVILTRETSHVPEAGDIVKVGHSLSGFDAFTVNRRLFWSRPASENHDHAFQEVLVLVSPLA